MSSVGVLTPVQGTPHGRSAPTQMRREAFYFMSQGQPLFAWLHLPAQPSAHGVVLCAPLGYEQVHAHRSFRVLADRLAEAGVTALRFDYHGTGDSAGCDEDSDRLATWLANIRDAIRYVREEVGCEKISLAGLRMGATLAMQAAAAEKIDDLLLWAPVANGRHYVREMKALGLTATIKAAPLDEAPHDIDAAGFVFTKQTADELSKIDLFKVTPRCRRVFILTRDDVVEDQRLLDHLSAHNVAVLQSAMPGFADMMAEPHFSKVPEAAIARAVEWLRSDDPAGPPHAVRSRSHEAVIAAGMRERVEIIEGNLISVQCMPTMPTPELPLVVMLNAGAAYRIGPNRLSVILARALAEHGFRSMRLDLAGLGDNVPPGDVGVNDSYAETAFRDIETTLEFAKRNQPGERVVLLGLCSGAYFAFQAAVQIADSTLEESVLINPLTFFWKDGMTIDDSPTKEDQVADYYWRSAVQPGKWLKLLSGQSKIGIAGAFAQFWRRWQQRQQSPTPALAIVERPAGHPERDDLPGDLTRLASRGRPLTCFFASADPGFHIMNVRAKNKIQELQASGLLSLTFIDDADHTFSFRSPRKTLIEAICNHLCRRYAGQT